MSSTSRNFEGFQGGRGAGGRALPQAGTPNRRKRAPAARAGTCAACRNPVAKPEAAQRGRPWPSSACLHKRPHEGPRNSGSGTLATRGPFPPCRLPQSVCAEPAGGNAEPQEAGTRARPQKKRAFQRPASFICQRISAGSAGSASPFFIASASFAALASSRYQ